MMTYSKVQHGVGRGDLTPPPPPPGRTLEVQDLLPSVGDRHSVPSGELPREGHKLDHPPVSLHAPTRAVHYIVNKVGNLTLL